MAIMCCQNIFERPKEMFYHNIKRSKKRYIECPQVVPREQYYKTLLTSLKLYQRIASFNVPFEPFGAIVDAKFHLQIFLTKMYSPLLIVNVKTGL